MAIQQTIRRAATGIGAVLLFGGFVLLFLPDFALSLPVPYFVATGAIVVAFLLSIWIVRVRYNTSQNQSFVPDVEGIVTSSTPGDDLDELIYRLTTLREGTLQIREKIQSRIAEIAITVIMQRFDCSREQAVQHLEDGTWTEDSTAAGFFRSGASTNTSLVDDLVERFTSKDTAYERQLKATVDAIERLGDFEYSDRRSESAEEPYDGPIHRLQDLVMPEDGDPVTDTVRYRALLSTHRWTGISAFALAAFTFGFITTQPPLILASAVGVGVAGYAQVASAPPLAPLEATREVSDDTPQPGDEIEVTVTVENTGDTFLTDLRIVDNVPATMQVIEGSARLGTALRPGQTATINYTAVVERGRHDWPVRVLGRDPSGALERDALVDTDTTVECLPRLKTTAEIPVRLQTSVYSGGTKTNVGGEGLEFHSVRDYMPGDPKRRIDWKSFARTGEFSTVDFRQENAARIVLLFDCRESSYVAAGPGRKHAVDRAVDASFDVFASLNDQGHLIGIAAYNRIPCWLGPSAGSLHLQRVRELFVDHPALSSMHPDLEEEEAGRYVDPIVHVRRRLPQNTQIFLFSPLTDNYTYEVARRLDGAGHLVTVISPDPTAARTIGQRIGRLERSVIIKRLRDHGVRVVDWGDDRSLNIELEHATRRWSA